MTLPIKYILEIYLREIKLKNIKDKIKRIMALLCVVVLVALIVLNLIFAITDNPNTMSLFKATFAIIILVPCMLYVYQLVFRVIKGTKENHSEE